MRSARFMVAIARPIVHLLFPFKVQGKENIPKKDDERQLVVCCNHISLVDPAFILCSVPKHIHFMAKAEMFKSKIGNWFFNTVMGAFPVDRGKGDVSALDVATNLVKNQKLLGIFPEGTRSKDGTQGQFKSGAAYIVQHTGADVLPVCVCTKSGRVKLFRRTIVRFGPVITREELGYTENETPNLRKATRVLSARVKALHDEVFPCP